MGHLGLVWEIIGLLLSVFNRYKAQPNCAGSLIPLTLTQVLAI